MSKPLIGMVAGEPSGDLIASKVIQGLHKHNPNTQCYGIGGPEMQKHDFQAWHSIDALSVFGYVDALKNIPSLIRTYNNTKKRLLNSKPDVFVGIDAPDFNLRIEAQLRQNNIPTVHFVGPSIWAWRYERIHKIRQAVSHMLVLFPFEQEIYEKEDIPVTYVGHPLAKLIPKNPDQNIARKTIGLDENVKTIAIMPGSRASELNLLTPRFLQAVQILQDQDPDLHVLIPMVNTNRKQQLDQFLVENPIKNCMVLIQDQYPNIQHPISWVAMQASDAVLAASGTATLEAALFKKPLVISYVLSPLMRRLMAWKSGQSKPLTPWVGLPNILSQDFIVPELIQEDATPEKLAQAVHTALTDTDYIAQLNQKYMKLHNDLDRDTPYLATQAILKQIEKGV